MAKRARELKSQGKSDIEIYEQLVLEGVEEKMRTRVEFVISATQASAFRAYLACILTMAVGDKNSRGCRLSVRCRRKRKDVQRHMHDGVSTL